MQTTAGVKRFSLGRFKAAILVIGVAGLLTVGAAIAITREDASSTPPVAADSGQSIHPDEALRLELEMIREHELYSSARDANSGWWIHSDDPSSNDDNLVPSHPGQLDPSD